MYTKLSLIISLAVLSSQALADSMNIHCITTGNFAHQKTRVDVNILLEPFENDFTRYQTRITADGVGSRTFLGTSEVFQLDDQVLIVFHEQGQPNRMAALLDATKGDEGKVEIDGLGRAFLDGANFFPLKRKYDLRECQGELIL